MVRKTLANCLLAKSSRNWLVRCRARDTSLTRSLRPSRLSSSPMSRSSRARHSEYTLAGTLGFISSTFSTTSKYSRAMSSTKRMRSSSAARRSCACHGPRSLASITLVDEMSWDAGTRTRTSSVRSVATPRARWCCCMLVVPPTATKSRRNLVTQSAKSLMNASWTCARRRNGSLRSTSAERPNATPKRSAATSPQFDQPRKGRARPASRRVAYGPWRRRATGAAPPWRPTAPAADLNCPRG